MYNEIINVPLLFNKSSFMTSWVCFWLMVSNEKLFLCFTNDWGLHRIKCFRPVIFVFWMETPGTLEAFVSFVYHWYEKSNFHWRLQDILGWVPRKISGNSNKNLKKSPKNQKIPRKNLKKSLTNQTKNLKNLTKILKNPKIVSTKI